MTRTSGRSNGLVVARTGSHAGRRDEAWLGQKPFRRDARRMHATPFAAISTDEVAHAFERVSRAAQACGRPSRRHPVADLDEAVDADMSDISVVVVVAVANMAMLLDIPTARAVNCPTRR